jgi:hypothetical protein
MNTDPSYKSEDIIVSGTGNFKKLEDIVIVKMVRQLFLCFMVDEREVYGQ